MSAAYAQIANACDVMFNMLPYGVFLWTASDRIKHGCGLCEVTHGSLRTTVGLEAGWIKARVLQQATRLIKFTPVQLSWTLRRKELEGTALNRLGLQWQVNQHLWLTKIKCFIQSAWTVSSFKSSQIIWSSIEMPCFQIWTDTLRNDGPNYENMTQVVIN